ncbi:MAG: hypothetical protein HY816_21695 [Candidatus Wallbacteria bacterium]|nr:hypothetical protein [Candidatus Wallbacteria bacterium]
MVSATKHPRQEVVALLDTLRERSARASPRDDAAELPIRKRRAVAFASPAVSAPRPDARLRALL